MATTILEVDGMTCQGCVGNVTTLLQGIAGVEAVEVTLAPGRAQITHADRISAAALIDAVEGAGFDARPVA